MFTDAAELLYQPLSRRPALRRMGLFGAGSSSISNYRRVNKKKFPSVSETSK